MRINNMKTKKRFLGGGLKRIYGRTVAFVISIALMMTSQGQFYQVFAKNNNTEAIYISYDGNPENDGKSPETALDFYSCFSDEGELKPGFSGKTLVFCGDFTNLDVNYITISNAIDLIGDGAKFKNVAFIITSDNVTLKDFEVTQEADIYTIYVNDCENVTIEGNTINMTALSGNNSYAVYSCDCDNLIMRDNKITYVGNTDGTVFNNAVRIEAMQSDGKTTVEDNTFDIALPSVDVAYDYDTYESIIYNEGIVFDGCAELTISGNDIKVRSNDKITQYGYDSIYGVSVLNLDHKGENDERDPREMDVIMEGNSIDVSGETYTYAVNVDAHSSELFVDAMTHINLVDNTVKVSGEYAAYALSLQNCVKVEAEGNDLYADAKELNYGINLYPYWGPNDEVSIVNNTITGKGRYSAGMDIISTEDIKIIGNKINSLGSNALDEYGRVVSTGTPEHPARTSPAIILGTGSSADLALVSGNEIRSGGAGLILNGRNAKYNVVDNDIIVNDAKYGFKLDDTTTGTVIENNTIKVTTLEDDEGYGIYSYDSDSVSIRNNTIEYTGKSDGLEGHFNNAVYVSGEEGVSDIEIADNALDLSLTTESVFVPGEGERPILGGLVFDGCDKLSLLDNTVSMNAVASYDLYCVDMMVLKANPKNAIGKAVVKGNSIVSPNVGIHCLVPSEMTENLVMSDGMYTVDVFAEGKVEDNASTVSGNKLRSGQLWGDKSVHATNVDTVQDNKDIGHRHEFTYAADGATITATCTEENCTLPPSTEGSTDHVATLTIVAPLHTTYGDGKEPAAVVTDENSIRGEAKVMYQKKTGETYGEATETAPADAGTYKAGITLNGVKTAEGEGKSVTASLDYAIASADPIANAPTGVTAIYGQTLSDVTLTNPAGNTPGTWSWADAGTTSVGSVGDHTFKANYTPTDSTNYNSKSNVDVNIRVNKAANPANVTSEATVMVGGNTVNLSANVTRNGAEGTASYEISGDNKGCSVDSNGILTSGSTTGTVTVNVSITADNNYNALAATPITVTITAKGTQTISADNITVTYGETGKSVSATVTDPATGGGAISYAVKGGSGDYIVVDAATGALTIIAVPAGGLAYVAATAAETQTLAEATKDITITIDKAPSSAAKVEPNNRVFDDRQKPLVTVTGEAVGGTMKYAIGNETAATEAYTDEIPTATEPGTYYVWYKVKGDGNHNDTDPVRVEVKISKIEVTSITLRAVSGTTMVPDSEQQLEATIIPSNAPITLLTWKSSDETVATVSGGLVTAKGVGEAKITASWPENDVEASITISVVEATTEVSSITIDPLSVKSDLKPGNTFRLTAVIDPADATDKTVRWESTNEAVATVGSNGMVTVKGTGETDITVKAANDKTDTIKLTVNEVPVNGIAINTSGGDDYLVVGKPVKLSVTVDPANATDQGVTWSSSDDEVATVDENGTVTAKKEGKVTITATSKDDDKISAQIDFIVFYSDDSLYVEYEDGSDYPYTGKAITPVVNVYYRGKLLTRDTDYSVSYKNNKNANDASDVKKAPTVKVTGKTVAAVTEATFRILPIDIGDESVVMSEEVNIAAGKTAAPLLYYGGTKLGNADLINQYAKAKFDNSRTITVYGKGNFTGEREIWINVKTDQEVKQQPKIKVESFKPVKRYYNGQPQTLSENEIKVTSADKAKKPLEMDKDFYIAYPSDITSVGTVKVTVVGMGDYTGSVNKTYKIEAATTVEKDIGVTFPYAEEEEIEGKTYDTFVYTPGGMFPYVEVKVMPKDGEEETLVSGRDYKVTYKDNKKATKANKGKLATATITFNGNYKSLKKMTKEFYIKQADLSKADVYTQDKMVTKGDAKYPLQAPIVDIDGVTVKKNEYTVTYKDAEGNTIDNKSKLNLKEIGESAEVTVEITAKKDKNGNETGNYTDENKTGSYKITLADASKDLSKAKVIIQKKGDDTHKAVRKFDFTGNPIVIGEEPYEGYKLYVFLGKNANDPNKVVLEESTDYTVEYSNNVKAGKATIILNAVDRSEKCFGSKTHTFNIVKGIMRWVK